MHPHHLLSTPIKIEMLAGSILEIVAENGCTDFLLKGTVKQNAGWLTDKTIVRISAAAGATSTCHGRSFPSAEGSTTSRNGQAHFPEAVIRDIVFANTDLGVCKGLSSKIYMFWDLPE